MFSSLQLRSWHIFITAFWVVPLSWARRKPRFDVILESPLLSWSEKPKKDGSLVLNVLLQAPQCFTSLYLLLFCSFTEVTEEVYVTSVQTLIILQFVALLNSLRECKLDATERKELRTKNQHSSTSQRQVLTLENMPSLWKWSHTW